MTTRLNNLNAGSIAEISKYLSGRDMLRLATVTRAHANQLRADAARAPNVLFRKAAEGLARRLSAQLARMVEWLRAPFKNSLPYFDFRLTQGITCEAEVLDGEDAIELNFWAGPRKIGTQRLRVQARGRAYTLSRSGGLTLGARKPPAATAVLLRVLITEALRQYNGDPARTR